MRMQLTDTKERGLEYIIVNSLLYEAGYENGQNSDYDREHAVDITRLMRFLKDTQAKKVEMLGIGRKWTG
jgi:type I restriction enzyme R subunit